MITFTIRCPESRSNARKHRMEQAADDKEIQRLVWAALAESGQIQTSHAKLILAATKTQKIVKFTRFWGGASKEMDFGNFVASCKPVLDALKLQREGLIYDDAPAYCREMYDQVKDSERAGQLKIEVS